MARAVAKVSPHIKGGASNAIYIGSLREFPARAAERGGQLAEMAEGDAVRAVGDDAVWGWNVPWVVADDGYGVWETEEGRALLEDRSLTLAAHHMGLGRAPRSAERLSADDKRENLVAHFSALADLEERRGGLSHLRIIVTVGREVTIGELKEMVNTFLRENFPLCPAFAAIHDDTKHRHAHIYVHARQLDDRKLDLGQDYFRLDESWMRVCAERLGDPEIYTRHIELKEETRGWSDRAEKAAETGKPLPPKPDRWGDHHDTLLVFRPLDDRWCGRLRAQARVAGSRVRWLEITKARPEEIGAARERAERLGARLAEAAARRGESRREAKRTLPPEVLTVEESRDLLSYERDTRRATPGGQSHVAQRKPVWGVSAAAREGQLGFNFDTPAGAQPQIIPDCEDELSVRPPRGRELPAESARPASDEGEPRVQSAGRPNPGTARLGEHDEPTLENTASEQQSSNRDNRIGAVTVRALPDDQIAQLTVEYELAKARVAALRAAEEEFEAAPHRWESPTFKRSLAEIDEKLTSSAQRGESVDLLRQVREQIREELAAERARSQLRTRQAGEETRALEERLRREDAARAQLGLLMPEVLPTKEELREFVACAVAARDARQLKRFFAMDLELALKEAEEKGSGEPVRALAERYAAVELMAEVRADRSRCDLSAAINNTEKIVFPARDETGRDVVLTLEHAGAHKGVSGFVKKIVAGTEGRRLRERLAAAKDAYLNQLRSDCASRDAFREAAREIARECGEQARGFGDRAPVVSALSDEEIAEVRDNAEVMTEPKRGKWLNAATQAQRTADERAAAQRRSVDIYLPSEGGGSLEEAAREQLARERALIEQRLMENLKTHLEREQSGRTQDYDRGDRSPQQRPRGSRGRSR